MKNQTTNTRVLICQGLEEEITHLGSHGPASSRLGSLVSAVSWMAGCPSHSGFEQLTLCQPWLQSPPALTCCSGVAGLERRREQHFPLWNGRTSSFTCCFIHTDILELIVKDLPLQRGITFKWGGQAHKDSTTAGIRHHTIYYNYTIHLLCAP